MKPPRPPANYRNFMERHPEVGDAYETLGSAVSRAGPLDERSVSLVKLGIAAGMQHEGATHAHARKALAVGLTPDEVRGIGNPNALRERKGKVGRGFWLRNQPGMG